MTTEYSRKLTPKDDPEGHLGELFDLAGHNIEVIVTDNIYSSVLKRNGDKTTAPDYDWLHSMDGMVTLLKSSGLTHAEDDVADGIDVFINPEVTPGVAAHESLHVVERTNIPHPTDESWSYPEGALTDAVLGVMREANAQKKFAPTVASLPPGAFDGPTMEKAIKMVLKQAKDARSENGLPSLSADEEQAIRRQLDGTAFGNPSLSEIMQMLGILVDRAKTQPEAAL